MKNAIKKVLIVEDHPIVAESLKKLLEIYEPGITVIHSPTGKRGLAYLNGDQFDIVILDINLPDISGIEFCTIAKGRIPDMKVVCFTSIAKRFMVEQMLSCGADGVILKTADPDEMISGIRQITNGSPFLGSGVRELFQRNRPEDIDKPVISSRENEILNCISEGLTNKKIAEKLFISCSTVNSHRKNLLLKLKVGNTAKMIKHAIYNGLI